MLRSSSPHFIPWAVKSAAGFTPRAASKIPVHAIHGARDRILPASRSRADVIVDGAGHLLTLTHSDAVNEFLREVVARAAR